MEDLSHVDWTDVLSCDDLDIATDILTTKLRDLLNIHAPWIIFQQRKFFKPWITKDTREMMIERDRLKSKAKDLACRDLELKIEPSEGRNLPGMNSKKLETRLLTRNVEMKLSIRKINYLSNWVHQRHFGNLQKPSWDGNLLVPQTS